VEAFAFPRQDVLEVVKRAILRLQYQTKLALPMKAVLVQ
jgi:hypothetical protein